MRDVRHKIRQCVLLAACFPLLASCGNEVLGFKAATGVLAATSFGVFSDPDVNLKEKNYAAADYLQSQIKNKVSYYQHIAAKPLQQADHPGVSSPLGLSISEGVGLRLQELGNKVLLHDVAPYGNTSLYPAPENTVNAAYVLNGAYIVKTKQVDVFLRVIDTKTHRVIAQFDYAMPLSRELKKLSETEPKAFRIKK